MHQIGHGNAALVGVGLAHVREITADGAGRSLIGVRRADELAGAGNRLDALEDQGDDRAALHELGHRVVDRGPEPVFEVEVMPPGEVGVHPDHLAGNHLEHGIFEAGEHAPDQAPSYGVGLEQHQRPLNSGVVTHDVPLKSGLARRVAGPHSLATLLACPAASRGSGRASCGRTGCGRLIPGRAQVGGTGQDGTKATSARCGALFSLVS